MPAVPTHVEHQLVDLIAQRTLYLVECLLGDDDAQRDWRLVRIVDDLRQL